MLYDIEVRPGPDSDFFQYYTETVEAATSHDAVRRVERRNPGCNVRCCRSYNAPSSGGSLFSGGGSSDTGGYLALGAVLLGIWLLVEFWWIIVPAAVIGGFYWFLKD